MRIIFAGTPEFSAITLEALVSAGHEIVCAYTQPDRKTGRGQKLTAPPVKQCAQKHNIKVLQPLNFKDHSELDTLKQFDADVMVVVAYGLLLPQAVLDTPKYGCLNIHAFLLPKWRGAAPIQRSIEAGDDKTGVCIMQMDAGLDTGDVLLRAEIDIQNHDTSASLHEKLAVLGAETLLNCLENLTELRNNAEPQEHDQASYAHKISKQEAIIDWQQSAQTIDQQIRAFNPWPVCQTYLTTSKKPSPIRIRVWQASAVDLEHSSQCGEIIKLDKTGIYIACQQQSTLKLITVQPDGSKPMPANDFINGHQLSVGMLLLNEL